MKAELTLQGQALHHRGMRRIKITVALVTLVTFTAAAGAQTMHRCKGLDGQLSFQQMPCAPGTGKQIEAREVPTTVMGENILSRARRNASGEMTEEDLIRRFGQPTVVNTDTIDGQVTRQYVYRFADGTQYYYARDGIVYAAQDRPGLRRQTPQPCHSRQEIANARTSASSITLNPEQRRAAQQRVEDMEKCRR